ncbi:glycosyl hydrolase [Aureococcus anophagefferens]|nr:glycosyl hydrolase [Aureococcus anophagefferens]
MGSFEPPRASPRPDDEDRDPAPPPLPRRAADAEAHRLKVQRLALPAWWLPCERWKLVWHDDFDYDGPPDPRKWGSRRRATGGSTTRTTPELQHYTSGRRENAWVEGGVLRVTARREPWGDHAYTSARLHTKLKGDWLYGRIELLLCIDGETVHSFERGEAPVRRSGESPGDDDAVAAGAGRLGATRSAEPECTDWPFDQRFFLINLAER